MYLLLFSCIVIACAHMFNLYIIYYRVMTMGYYVPRSECMYIFVSFVRVKIHIYNITLRTKYTNTYKEKGSSGLRTALYTLPTA